MISSYHHYYFIFRIPVEALGEIMVLMDKEEETQLIEVEVGVIMSQVDQV